MVVRTIAVMLACVAMLGGCVRYEYHVIEPPDLAVRVPPREVATVRSESAEYRLRAHSAQLVIDVYNPGDGPLLLSGSRSVLVDPNGQSHPLLTQTIAPASYIRLWLPPPPSVAPRAGPSVSIGFGGAYRYGRYRREHDPDRGERYRHGYGRYAYYDPFYFDSYRTGTHWAYDELDPASWRWTGESTIRLVLVFERDGRFAEDALIISRRRAG